MYEVFIFGEGFVFYVSMIDVDLAVVVGGVDAVVEPMEVGAEVILEEGCGGAYCRWVCRPV